MIKCSQERETVKKNYSELLQLEFELEALSYIKSENYNLESKIKEFLQKVQINKYKPSESKKRIHANDEITANETSNKHNYNINNKSKSIEITTKDVSITHHQTKPLKNIQNEKVHNNLMNGVRNNPQKKQKNKPPIIEENIPKITDILNLVEEEKPEEEISLMHRIRLNRKGKLVIDRYIRTPNSTNPFDNSFDNSYNVMKKYEEDLSKIIF